MEGIPSGSGIIKEYRKNWARLIQKIYEVDSLTCPKCQGVMRIISFIEDREVIKAILKHLGLWLVKSKPTPKAHARWWSTWTPRCWRILRNRANPCWMRGATFPRERHGGWEPLG